VPKYAAADIPDIATALNRIADLLASLSAARVKPWVETMIGLE
jgi:hypothetical protein